MRAVSSDSGFCVCRSTIVHTNHAQTPIWQRVESDGKNMRSGIEEKTVVASVTMAAQMAILRRETMTVMMVMTCEAGAAHEGERWW